MRLRAFAAPGASERPGCRLAPTEPLFALLAWRVPSGARVWRSWAHAASAASRSNVHANGSASCEAGARNSWVLADLLLGSATSTPLRRPFVPWHQRLRYTSFAHALSFLDAVFKSAQRRGPVVHFLWCEALAQPRSDMMCTTRADGRVAGSTRRVCYGFAPSSRATSPV